MDLDVLAKQFFMLVSHLRATAPELLPPELRTSATIGGVPAQAAQPVEGEEEKPAADADAQAVDELGRLHEIANERGLVYDDTWDAAKLRDELGFAPDEPLPAKHDD